MASKGIVDRRLTVVKGERKEMSPSKSTRFNRGVENGRGLMRDGSAETRLARPKFSEARTGTGGRKNHLGKIIFLFQPTTSRIGRHARFMPSVLKVMTVHSRLDYGMQ